MHSFLKQSTASQTRIIGPFVDDTDFKTAETALTISNTDIKLSKNGGASVDKNSGGGTHIANGNYAITLDATDTNTVGELFVSVLETGALLVVAKFTVLEEAIYDALFGASATGFDASGRVDVGKWLGTAAATPTVAGVPEVDVTHWLGTAAATPSVAGVPEVDATHWVGGAIPAVTVTGVPEVDVTHWIGTAAATPSVAGVPEVDVTHLGGVSQSLLDLKDFADSGYDPATNKVEGVKTVDTVTAVTGLTAADVGTIKTRVETALPSVAPDTSTGLPTVATVIAHS